MNNNFVDCYTHLIKAKTDLEYMDKLRNTPLYAESLQDVQNRFINIMQNLRESIRSSSQLSIKNIADINKKLEILKGLDLKEVNKNSVQNSVFSTNSDILSYAKKNEKKILSAIENYEESNGVKLKISNYIENTDLTGDIWNDAYYLASKTMGLYPKGETSDITYIDESVRTLIRVLMNAQFSKGTGFDGKDYKNVSYNESPVWFIQDDWIDTTPRLRHYFQGLPANDTFVLPSIYVDSLFNYENYIAVSLYLHEANMNLVNRHKDKVLQISFGAMFKRFERRANEFSKNIIDILDSIDKGIMPLSDVDKYYGTLMQSATKELNLRYPIKDIRDLKNIRTICQSYGFYTLKSDETLKFHLTQAVGDTVIISKGPVEFGEAQDKIAYINVSLFERIFLSQLQANLSSINFNLKEKEDLIKKMQNEINTAYIKNPGIIFKSFDTRDGKYISETIYGICELIVEILYFQLSTISVTSIVLNNLNHPVYDYIKTEMGAIAVVLFKDALSKRG